MLDILESAGELFGALSLIAGLLAIHPRTRRVAYAAGYRFPKRHLPPWALAVVGVCLLIPGPLDEIVVTPVLVLIALRDNRRRRIFTRYVRIAWKG